jgi:alpha-glucosidase
VSALHLDIDHMDRFRVFTFDEARFGRVESLAARARDAGTRLVAIVDPAVRRDAGFEIYTKGVEGGHFVTDAHGSVVHGTVWPGWAAFPDFGRPSTRAWWGSHYAALTSRGFAGAWHDMNEPTSITLWGDRTLPRSAVHDLEGRAVEHEEAHNVYGILMNEAGFEALAALDPDSRPFVLSRAGWAGLARTAWHWTADVEGSAAGLAQQVPTFLGLGLSSVPFTGSDIGGFNGTPSPALYVRWLELGVLSPFCRTHCVLGSPDREPWRFDAPVEAAIGELLRLRYRLLPHLYRLAEAAHRLGHPMLRPVDWPVGGEPTGTTASTEAFLLGDELLAVPVADPDATTVEVSLPPGRWRRLRLCAGIARSAERESDEHGAARVVLDAPIGQPVLLQRAGTVIVLDDAWCDASAALGLDHATKCWALHVVLDDQGRAHGVGYEDAGDGYGPSRADAYDVSSGNGELVVTWASSGEYERQGAVTVVVHGAAYGTATCDGAEAPIDVGADATTVRLAGSFSTLVLR